MRLLLRSDWHWNSMATLRQACRRWPLRKLGVSEKSGLFSNCSTENACAVSACAFTSLSKLHQTADQPRGEAERDFNNQNSIASVSFGDLQWYFIVINIWLIWLSICLKMILLFHEMVLKYLKNSSKRMFMWERSRKLYKCL